MKRSGNENVNLDKLHYHEALDRTYIEQCNLENSLGGHPVIQNHPELKALYNESVENLEDLYQKIANITSYKSGSDLKGAEARCK
ncbi:hypothetical protein BMR02_15905 [Methylococcaceae bacterium HT1]|nr:hypothetical protein BMR02_15905 [Methylococcaceae bacterium HT1]TXL13022.1 hypothetical protein BMR04_14715 [Methylococcaceae bacterium HT3]TXL21725.1 hypothetical protein BMR03_12320 [Methylococcaceae bacterium HT2]